jgi:hypothetical protein
MSVLLSIVALSSCATATLDQDTFASLKDDEAPETIEEFWVGFDPRLEPLDREVLKVWSADTR